MLSKRQPVLTLTKKDFDVKTFRSGGKGGQHQNSRDTGVRITHKETGISKECRDERSQLQNKKKAFRKLCNDKIFRNWLAMKTEGEEKLEQKVKDALRHKNLRIEFYDKDKKQWCLMEDTDE